MEQENILQNILSNYRAIESLQVEINHLVRKNREKVKENPRFEDGYTESIESYYLNH